MENNRKKKAAGLKKSKRYLKWILIGLGSVMGLLVLVVLIMGGALFSRLAKPGTVVFGDAEEFPEIEETPAPTLAATPVPGATPVPPTPTPTPEPSPEEPQPLDQWYPQTRLTNAQQSLMASLNADTDQFTNILLIGVDRRGRAGNSQADTLMIASLDQKNGRLKLTSLLRDLWVDIPGYGEFRINSAAAKGGVPLLMDTINHNYNLNINRYVLVDFTMFEKLVDKMGGLTLRMTAEEISAANDCIAGLNKQTGVSYLWDGFIFANAGNVKCTGKQALGYARIRKIDSDFVRTNRQFKVLTAIFAKFKAMNPAKQYDILYDLVPLVETNLPVGEIVDIGLGALSLDVKGILHQSVPVEGIYRSARVKGSSVLVSDLPAHAWLMHQFIYFSDDIPDEATVLSAGASLPPRTPSPTLDPLLDPALNPGQYPPGGVPPIPGDEGFNERTPKPWDALY